MNMGTLFILLAVVGVLLVFFEEMTKVWKRDVAEEEMRRKQVEEKVRKRAEEKEMRRKKAEEEERLQKIKEAEEEHKRAEEEARRRQHEEQEKRRRDQAEKVYDAANKFYVEIAREVNRTGSIPLIKEL